MDRVEERYQQFCKRFEQDLTTDPSPFMEGLEPAERAELGSMIEFFVTEAPRPNWDPERFAGSQPEKLIDNAMADAGLAAAEPWSSFLPALRNAARIKRDALAERLAESLGLATSSERVKFYYHHMERGNLPAKGVSNRVLEKLGEVLGVSAESLRRSGAAQGPPPDREGAYIFARRISGAPGGGAVQARLTPDLSGDEEVDRLFTGDAEEGM